jgi:calcineurin-like phosphoesterase family protein
MIYMTSDWHLGHKNIIKYCDRPFQNITEMNTTILDNYFEIITDEDIVFFVGDLFFGSKGVCKNIFRNLPGQKHLIIGNHDKWSKSFYRNECGFITAKFRVMTDEYEIVHSPVNFNSVLSNRILIHGHVHAKYPIIEFSHLTGLNGDYTYDVGVDANYFKPIPLNKIKETFQKPFLRKPK